MHHIRPLLIASQFLTRHLMMRYLGGAAELTEAAALIAAAYTG